MRRSIIAAMGIIIAACAFFYALRPVNDADFFWHLKTGEYIYQHKAIPSEDPFSFTTPSPATSRVHFILTSYWFSQVIFYLSYSLAGMKGIVLLRGLMIGLLLFMMARLRKGDTIIYQGLLLISAIIMLEGYPMERPQVFSFIFFAALLRLLNRLRKEEYQQTEHGNALVRKETVLLAGLMVLWANMHGGVLIGQATIMVVLFIEAIKFCHPFLDPPGRRVYLRLLVAGAAGLLFSFLNPNSYHALLELINMPVSMRANNLEFQSTFELFRRYSATNMILFWSVVCLAAAGILIKLRKPDITETVLLVCIGFFSLTQIRYIAFFLIVAIPAVAEAFSLPRIRSSARLIIIGAALCAAGYFVRDESGLQNISSRVWVNEYFYPAKAADFILSQDLKGNMYNEQNWGGYLIWRLGPERKVFMDGRQLSEAVFSQANLIDMASPEKIAGLPLWKSMLDAYGIRYIVVPFFQLNGTLKPLVVRLLEDAQWRPVFFSLNSTIFVKDSPENYPVLRRYSIPREIFIDDLINVCSRLIRENERNIFALIAKGDLYILKKMPEEARRMYEQALKAAPFNRTVQERLKDYSSPNP
ncbi:MAG: hypothetical protein HZA15_16305 [Nitrospirae bacterium]|nr:hypothetical protein [Nitrospirota bacterium]